MRIAIWQTGSSSLAELRDRCHEASARGARLIITPEAFATGYDVAGLADLAQPADGDWQREIAEIAVEADIAILYGHPERCGDAVFNSATLTERDGRVLARHHKTHLYGEVDQIYTPGSSLDALADIDGIRIGVLICYDVEFPETVRALALAGADLIAVPTALMRPYETVTRLLIPARAYESQVFIAYANRCGAERTLEYCGESCIVGLKGEDLARAGSSEELLIADIDTSALPASRADHSYLTDRRPELYAPLLEGPLR